MSANVCIHVEKIGKQPGVRINRHSTESSESQLWSQVTLINPNFSEWNSVGLELTIPMMYHT